MSVRGLTLVGWYHSHPTYQPDPSVRDIAAQQHYQTCMKVEKTSYEPCVGFIVCKYNNLLKMDPCTRPLGRKVQIYLFSDLCRFAPVVILDQ